MPRFVWLHGFASGPGSGKGTFVRERLRERGVELALPDLNQPSFRELTVSRMLATVDALAGGEPLVLFGSSLGGVTAAAWAAAHPAQARRLVLLAPAFDLAARWEERMGHQAREWKARGAFAFDHYQLGGKHELAWGFLEDAQRLPPFPLPACPTLVIQGTRDDVVDPRLAPEFARRMEAEGREVQLVLRPEGHELTADLPSLWAAMEPFLGAELGAADGGI